MKAGSGSGPRLFIALLCAAALAAIAYLVGAGRIGGFDRAIIDSLQGLESPGWTSVMMALGSIASGIPVAIIIATCCIALLVTRRMREFALFLAALAGSQLLNLALKWAFRRERPDFHRIIEETGYGFPSGNAMSAFKLFGIIVFLLWRHMPTRAGRAVLLLLGGCLILAVGASRVYLGVHYPSDILAGFLASGCWLVCAVHIFRRYEDRKDIDAGQRM